MKVYRTELTPVSFLERSSKLLEIFGIGRRKMPSPGFDFIDVEFCYHMRGKIFQLNSWTATLVALARNELAERIRSDCNPLAGLPRKTQMGFGF